MADIMQFDPRTLAPADWVGSIARGYALPAQVQNIQAQTDIRQQEAQRLQRENQGIQQYGQTGDPMALRGVDPILSAKLTDWYKSQPPESMQDIQKATAFISSIAPTINSKSWPALRPQIMKSYPGLPQDALPGEDASDQQLFQWANAGRILDANIKAMGQGPKVVAPGGALVAPTGQTLFQAPEKKTTVLTPEGGVVGQIEGTVKTLPKGYKPEILLPASGKGPAIQWTPGTPLPEGYLPSKAGRAASQSTDEDIDSMVQGLKEGTIAPNQLSKRAVDYNRIVARAQRQNINLPQVQLQYEAAKRAVSSLNSPQQIRLKGYAIGVVNTIDEISTLADQLKQSGITPLNRMSLEAKMKLAGNTPAGQLATRYVTAVNTLKEEFANLAQGGYAPTESVWNLANKQINENFGVDQMKASLGEIKRLINYRLQAFDEVQATMGGVGKGVAGSKGAGGVGATRTVTPDERQAYDAKVSQVQSMPDSPQKQQALKQLQDLGSKWGIK